MHIDKRFGIGLLAAVFTGGVVLGVALGGGGVAQAQAGGSLERIAPASALLGLATPPASSSQFVWLDAATVVHMITGTLFVVWLGAGGAMLLKGRAWIPG